MELLKFFDPSAKVPVLDSVPLRPLPGYTYIYEWSDKKKKEDWRVDGFRWKQDGSYRLRGSGCSPETKKIYFILQVGPREFTKEFSRVAIRDHPSFPNQVLVKYEGNVSVVVDFSHGNAKRPLKTEKAYYRTEPSLLAKIKEPTSTYPLQMYNQLLEAAPSDVKEHV